MKAYIFLFFFFIPFLSFSQDFNTYEWEIHNTANAPFKDDFMCEIMFDDAGLAWVTTSHMELYSFDGNTWTLHPLPEEWDLHGWLNEILITPEGKFWITGVVGHLLSYEPNTKKWDKIQVPGGQPWVIRQNDQGIILIATSISAGLLYQFHEGEITVLENKFRDAFEILFDEKGNALVGFRDGCYQFTVNPDGTYSPGIRTKISKEAFYDMEFDSKGTLWATSFSSLSLHRYKNGRWKKITGAPEKIYFDYNGDWKYVSHELIILPDDRVVFSTQFNASIAIFDGENWEAYNLPFSEEDGIGRLKLKDDLTIWCGTWKHGLNIFKPTEKNPNSTSTLTPIAGMKYVPMNDGEKSNFTPDSSRKIRTNSTYATTSDIINIEVKDYKKIDGDTISLYFNGELIIDKKGLSHTPFKLELELQKGNNELLLFAHNLGELPPNTASIKIIDNNTNKEINLDSDYRTNGRILFRRD